MNSFQTVGEILKNSKIKAKVDNHHMDLGLCPECGSDKTHEYLTQNGPDGYNTTFECLECGLLATS